jgi:hypothetical protein
MPDASSVPVIWIVLAAIAAAVIGAIVLYNQLVAMDVRCDNAWSDIDVQLKRRHDLIPNVVEAVKGYTSYERGTLDAVIAARSQAVGALGAATGATGGAMLGAAVRRAAPAWSERMLVPILSGVVAGESLMGVAIAVRSILGA